MTPHRPFLGIAYKVGSTFLFGCMGACVKALADVPTGQVMFFRSFLAFVPVAIAAAALPQGFAVLRTRRPWLHLRRSATGTAGLFFNFVAIQSLPLADATAIWFASPLFTVMLAALLLGETVRLWRWSAVLVGLCGVALALSPHLGAGADGPAALGAASALTSALLSAFVMIFIRGMSATEHPTTIVFYFMLTATLLSLASVPFGWIWPTPAQWALLAGSGLLGGAAQLLMTNAFRHAPASTVAPFEYASLIWAFLIGFLLFDEFPAPAAFAGSGVVIASGLFILWREHRLGRGRAAETPEGKAL